MLATVYHHLGDSWKWAREGANFAAVLFYNSIFRVSKWFFFSQIPTPQNLCISQGQQGYCWELNDTAAAVGGWSNRLKSCRSAAWGSRFTSFSLRSLLSR